LASVHWELTARGIKIETKDDIRRRIGRSPGKGDAIVLAWSEGATAAKRLDLRSRPLQIEGISGYNPKTGQYG
jgi:hypothetical protein